MPHGEPEVAARLRSAGVSEVDASPRRVAEYSSDASLYRVVPSAVAFPRSVSEVAIAVETCRELGAPLTLRGGGTSLAGNAIGSGVVLDVSRHLNRILSVDPDAQTATVEPGVILDDLQRAAAQFGLRFGPDPSTHSRCTIGGMIGNNACGSRALRYGRTADNVLALDVITGGGEVLRAGEATPQTSAALAALEPVVTANLAVIRTELGRFPRQVSGYSLEHLLPERGFDVPKALVGTEGTCAITTAATVALAVGFGDGFENVESGAIGFVTDGVESDLEAGFVPLDGKFAIVVEVGGEDAAGGGIVGIGCEERGGTAAKGAIEEAF